MKRNITLFSLVFIICFSCIFLTLILSDVMMKIELLFYIDSVSVSPGGSNSTYFRIINEYGNDLYFVTPKYLSPSGIHVSFSVTQIQELNLNSRPVISATIFADEDILKGTHAVNFWVESLDANGTKIKSQTYTVDVNVTTNSTFTEKTTSTTTSTFTSIATSIISEFTTTSEPFFSNGNEIRPENEGKISKKNVLIVLVIVIIVLVVMPIFSLKEKSSQLKSTLNHGDESGSKNIKSEKLFFSETKKY